MAQTIRLSAIGISPLFSISAEEFRQTVYSGVTRVPGDYAPPPSLGPNGGMSESMKITNEWSPWIDEKIVCPKFDGVCQYLGTVSNRPTLIKDYHMISMLRAADRLLAPAYVGLIQARVTGVGPQAPPQG